MAVEAQFHHLLAPQHLYKNTTRENNMNAMSNPGGAGAPYCPAALPAKRPRMESFTFLGEDVSSQVYSHMVDVDRLLVQHVVNARAELALKRRRFSGQIMAAVNESVSKQLRPKDEEIEHLKKLNYAMEERIKSLSMETNAWRYLAQTHEAAASALRANLEQALADQAAAEEPVAGDAESCCDGNSPATEAATKGGGWTSACRGCGGGEAAVLLLPCRHLCLCSACGPVIDKCPICKCSRTGSVNVNLC